ncbi:MAG: ATP-binding protein [Acidimicrobiales bacterium]
MTMRVAFDGVAADATEVRHQVGDLLSRETFEGDTDGVLLLTTELITNAIRHGAPPFALVVDLSADAVRICVEDGADGTVPALLAIDEDTPRLGGYGLHLVDQLSTGWGWGVTHGTGKYVWFSIDRRHRGREE